MSWTAPMTAVAGAMFPSADFNTYVRDNLNETGPAKATVTGSIMAGNGLNQIVQRTPQWTEKPGGATTTSTSYTDLNDGVGPSVTVSTGTSAMVWIYCNQYNTNGTAAWMTAEITGDSSFPASDNWAVQQQGTDGDRVGAGVLFDQLTAGVNTFTAKYRVSTAGTGYFSQRHIVVWPF